MVSLLEDVMRAGTRKHRGSTKRRESRDRDVSSLGGREDWDDGDEWGDKWHGQKKIKSAPQLLYILNVLGH
jgi:hypothetical protein